ncbi:MAG: S8 family serine peptidase [Promethearchaeota archaeon]|jgi:serine protease AprX
MNSKKIYPLFLKLIENQKEKSPNEKREFRTIISFENISKREKFISKNKTLKILNRFDLIPSFSAYLTKEQILKFDKDDSIKQIEEDQRLFLSLLEVNEILELDKYKESQISYTGKNVKVGIIDNGIKSDFQAISNVSRHQMKKVKRDAREITHGTLMASIIANQFKNAENNFIGIAPDVKFTDFDISTSSNNYNFSCILEVFDLINKKNIEIDILLISLTTSEASDGKDILSLACDFLVDQGIIIVSPAGNYGPDSYTIGSPSAASKVISFGALTKELLIERFSGKGPTIDERLKPDFCLPGSDVKIPLSDDLAVNVTGTSVAAAIGVGLVAIIKDFNADLTYNRLFEILKKTSTDLNLDNFSQGYGMPSLVKTFKNMNLFHEKILPYNILIKKAIKISVEFTILFIILYFLFLFF